MWDPTAPPRGKQSQSPYQRQAIVSRNPGPPDTGFDWAEQGLDSAQVCYENLEDTQPGSRLHRIMYIVFELCIRNESQGPDPLSEEMDFSHLLNRLDL